MAVIEKYRYRGENRFKVNGTRLNHAFIHSQESKARRKKIAGFENCLVCGGDDLSDDCYGNDSHYFDEKMAAIHLTCNSCGTHQSVEYQVCGTYVQSLPTEIDELHDGPTCPRDLP